MSEKLQKLVEQKFEKIREDITIGIKVKMKNKSQIGIVKNIRSKKAIVQVGPVPITVNLNDLVIVGEK